MSIAARTPAGDTSEQNRSWMSRVPHWELWSVPRRAVVLILTVDVLVAVAVAFALAHVRPTSADLARTGLLIILCVGYAEAAGRIERIRQYLGGGVATNARANSTSVWTFSAALVLPAGYAAAVVAAIYTHIAVVGYQQRTLRPYRVIYDWAAVTAGVLAVEAARNGLGAAGLHGGLAAAAGATAALILYSLASLAIVLVGVYLYIGATSWREVLPRWGDVGFETATLVLGLAAADLLLQLPWATPLLLALVAVLHRSTMIAELAAAARTDGKTGLLTATAWQQTAQQQLSQAGRNHHAASVLVLDLDRFKAVNDTYGHLVGDTALRAVAQCLKDELRDYDAVGRFGGEEFVALLPEVDSVAAQQVADRVRQTIRAIRIDDRPELRVSASIGIAVYPVHGTDLQALLTAADAALLTAKAAGRDRTELNRTHRILDDVQDVLG